MTGLRIALLVALALPTLACEDGDGAAGVGEAEGRALCRESCQKADMCFGELSDLQACLDACDNGTGNDTDADTCTPQEEDAIAAHLRGCNAGSCDDYLACIASTPGCGG